jgi:uncharacterized protein YndB with AHSA1/START domain
MDAETSVPARVARRFHSAPERVFDAWLDPGLIGRWMFDPTGRDEELVRVALDARPGGAFSFVVRRRGQEIDHVGEYLEIDRPRRLAFTWGVRQDPPELSRLDVEILPRESGAELGLTHHLHPSWAHFVSRAEESWARMLGRLAATLDES